MPVASPTARAAHRRPRLTGAVRSSLRPRWAGLIVLGVLTVACGSTTSSDQPSTTSAETGPVASASDSVPGVQPSGFTTAMLRVNKPDGEICDICVWLADSAEERGRGLMGVTDLGEPVGMAFLFASASENKFFMFQTPMPLSIAWFAADGMFVGTADMVPCVDEPRESCARYAADAEYTLAVEVAQATLDSHGLVPGSTVELIAGSEATTCPEVVSD